MMNKNKVRIVSATRLVPKVTVGQVYDVVVRQGKDFILDGYGGWVPLAQVNECDITVEGV